MTRFTPPKGKLTVRIRIFGLFLTILCICATHLLFWGTAMTVTSVAVSVIVGWIIAGFLKVPLAAGAAILIGWLIWKNSGGPPKNGG